jgi:hypothetical protein
MNITQRIIKPSYKPSLKHVIKPVDKSFNKPFDNGQSNKLVSFLDSHLDSQLSQLSQLSQPVQIDDSESDKDSEPEEDDPISLKDLLRLDDSKQIYNNNNRIIYRCKVKFLVEALNADEILFSENNRIVDNTRLETFTNFDSNKCDPIILAERIDKDSKYEIIDGQHRMSFLKNIDSISLDKKNAIMDMYIPLDVRICYDENDFKKYIDSTNNRKNFSSDQLRVFKFPILKDLLNKEYKYNLFIAPYVKIIEEEFKIQLFKTKYFEDFNNTPEVIFAKIVKINTFFKNIPEKCKLSLDKDMTKKSYIKERDTSEKLNIFLGLDKKLSWTIL